MRNMSMAQFWLGRCNLAFLLKFHYRFVNYINENYRHVNNTHGNMYDSTALVGLPRWVVTFRHDVVHSHMPKIDELRRAIFACRDW